ncbi:uncharacterized protein LOC131673252 isoform X3 [Phymastichus coffea]|uniref:uncharacterized protein LOC131673252 isoform X3 n=1 Tax=Phymastichus coffea TaxID=108790 RepID=UPI00273C6237|nr:uncharacterized protein LOC131673252 isoform X3 [Phymastichus coffea]
MDSTPIIIDAFKHFISGLHAIVILLLLGAIILVVGLVQLAPGATSDHKVSLLYAGSVLLILGIGLTGLRCYLLQCFIVTSKSPSSSPVNADNTSQLPSTSNL